MSRGQFCEFCEILDGRHRKTSQIIAQNQQFFAFDDIDDGSAVAHVLVCTKQHIESALHVKEPSQLLRMRTFGTAVLTNIYTRSQGKKPQNDLFRFGFHLPPLISVFHIHMHAFILPFRHKLTEMYKYTFGPRFKSVQQMTEMVDQRSKL